MGRVKATRWLDSQEYLEKNYGPEGSGRVLAALSDEDRALLSGLILPVSWLDYGAYLRYMFAADRVLGTGNNAIVADAACYTARKHFQGIYRIFISLSSPQFVMKRSTRVWRQYFDVGRLEVGELRDRFVALHLTEYADIPLKHDLSHTPFMEEILRMSGGKNPHGTHPLCMARGDDHCRWEFTWDD